MGLYIDVVCFSVLSDNISLDELIYSDRSNSDKEISFILYDNFSLVMNSKKQITIAVVVLSSLLSIVASISGLTTSEVFGQNSTSSNLTQAAGQQNTTNANSTSSNLTQTAAGPGPMARSFTIRFRRTKR